MLKDEKIFTGLHDSILLIRIFKEYFFKIFLKAVSQLGDNSVKILVVEDNKDLLDSHKKKLGGFFEVYTATSGSEGLELVKKFGPFNVVVSDMKMPGMNGIEFLSLVKDISPDTTRIIITGFANLESIIDAVNEGYIFRFLTKPCPSDKLIRAIMDGAKQYDLITYEKELNRQLVNEVDRRKKVEKKLKKTNTELKQMSVIDPLTGVYNRRHFFSQLEKEFKRSKRYSIPLSLLMLDLDFFKKVNDIYGHLIGDEVLKRTSYTITKNIRAIDIAGRYGGEEFCVILPETDKEHSVFAAERLRELIYKLEYSKSGTKFNVSCSIGIVTIEESISNINDFIEKADQAMYAAKKKGRNCVVTYDAIINQ